MFHSLPFMRVAMCFLVGFCTYAALLCPCLGRDTKIKKITYSASFGFCFSAVRVLFPVLCFLRGPEVMCLCGFVCAAADERLLVYPSICFFLYQVSLVLLKVGE